MTPAWLSGKAAITHTGIKRTLFYELVAAGVIRRHGAGKTARYRVAQLDDVVSRGIPSRFERQRLMSINARRKSSQCGVQK
jgi:hypothetical protein